MEKVGYILGLDLGVGSVGWSCMELDKEFEPCRIVQAGSRRFPEENGSMEDRRTARSIRRLIRRRKGRVSKIKSIFVQHEYLTREYANTFYNDKAHLYDSPYQLKVKGLSEKLAMDELFICLIHYAKYRGFKSNRKIKEEAKNTSSASEEQRLLFSINQTQSALQANNYTISQYLLNDPKFIEKKKNTDGEFKIGITREMIQEEVERLLKKQIEFGTICESFMTEYLDILLYQRSFSQGPNEPSPYHDPLRQMIGKCRFDGEDRAPISAPTYEKFNLVQKLNNIRYYETDRKDTKVLTKEQIEILIDKAIGGREIKYKLVQEVIGEKVNFIGLKLSRSDYALCAKKAQESPEKSISQIHYECKLDTSIYEMKMTKYIIRDLKKAGFIDVDFMILDEIADLLSRYKSDDEIKRGILNYELLSSQDSLFQHAVEELDEMKFKGFGKLSFSVLYKIVPHMMNGIGYSDAMKMVGYDHSSVKTKKEDSAELPPLQDAFEELDLSVTNRAVMATLQETKRIVNALIGKFGKPYAIHVEVARELTKNSLERSQLLDEQITNKMNNINFKMQMMNKFPHVFKSIQNIHHDDIVKYRLFNEQRGIDPYTLLVTNDEQVSKIFEKDLFNDDYEVDHILPYSKSFNDTLSNKVLVNTRMNREKGDRVPMEAFKDAVGIGKYTTWLEGIRNSRKKEFLTVPHMTEEMQNDFNARALNDTRYATKLLCSILNFYFPNVKIKSFTGQVTAKLKGVWGLNNVTHSYQSGDYRLKEEFDQELEDLYNKLDTIVENDEDDKKVTTEIKKNIIKLEKERDKKNRKNHLHHALDATIIACATNSLRRRVEIHEQMIRQQTHNVKNFRTSIFDSKTGEFIAYETKQEISLDYKRYFELTKNIDEKHFPVPYMEFREEVKLRIYEQNEKVLKDSLCSFSNYSKSQIDSVRPLMVSHQFNKKVNGRLHKATIYGVAPNPVETGNIVLTNRMAVSSASFKDKNLEKTYDKDGTQKLIYDTVKNWLNGYKDGQAAFAAHGGYPILKNGHIIKKVKLSHDAPKEEICIHKEKNQYVEKENVIQIHVYKKEDSDKLYFIGMDRYRVLNYKSDPDILIWWGQANNNKAIKYSDLKKEGFVLYQKLFKNQIIEVELNTGAKGLCKVVGFASGMFEIGSILGDGLDIIHSKIQQKVKARQTITVSTIKSIRQLSVSILGDIK